MAIVNLANKLILVMKNCNFGTYQNQRCFFMLTFGIEKKSLKISKIGKKIVQNKNVCILL